MKKLIRITTVPLSLEKLLEGQLNFMQQHYEVTAVSAEADRLDAFGKSNGVSTFCVEMTREITPWADMKGLYNLYSFLRKEKPLIVHTHTPKAGIVGMMAAKMAGVPVRLHTVAGMPLMETQGAKRRILETVEKLTYACATKVYPNSRGLRDFILEQGFTEESKVKILGNGSSNGIDTSYFDPANYSENFCNDLRRELGIPQEDLVFIFVGRLVRDKGINELVEAFSELQKKHAGISLLLVGPFEQELDPVRESAVKEINENPKIFSVGYQEDVRPYFSISDVLTFPSYREGFPNVVMQAGAMGIPSIVTNINGCNEIIREKVNGCIIPPKDQQALQDAMQTLIENPLVRNELKSNSRPLITELYEREVLWEILLDEYRRLEAEPAAVN